MAQAGTPRCRSAPEPRSGGRLLTLVVLIAGLLSVAASSSAIDDHDAVGTDGPVLHAPITGEIDRGLPPFLERVLDEAVERDAVVVLTIDTPGGRLDAALELRRALLGTPARTIAFVDDTALSAGALIALAAGELYVTPGAVLGAATPVDGATGETADEKLISAVRSIFRSTAQQRDRDPAIAEAMVDPSVVVEDLVAEGELLTLDDRQLVDLDLADGRAASFQELLAALDLDERQVEDRDPSPAERLVRVLTGTIVAPLLLTLGVWLLVGDLLTGGVGIGAAAGATLLGTFFYGHNLAGLSGWEDVVLVGIGVTLLLIEVFVTPGLGVAGVLGLLGVLGGGVLAMVDRDLDLVATGELIATATRVAATFVVVSAVIIAIVAVVLTRRRGADAPGPAGPATRRGAWPVRARWMSWFGSGDVLDSDRSGEGGPTGPATDQPAGASSHGSLVGRVGTALSDLRPAGVARIDGRRIDVVTDGDWLNAGTALIVQRDDGYRRVVTRTATDEHDENDHTADPTPEGT